MSLKDKMKLAITVFCGSRFGINSNYQKLAMEVGIYFAKNNIELIYGGAQIGLMGTLANACLANKGNVCGIMPHFLGRKEIVHHELSELIWVDSMDERKRLMISRANGFLVLPGGWGTLDEMYEVLTLQQIDQHQKPLWIINQDNYYSPLLEVNEQMVREGFLAKQHLDLVQCVSSLSEFDLKLRTSFAKEFDTR